MDIPHHTGEPPRQPILALRRNMDRDAARSWLAQRLAESAYRKIVEEHRNAENGEASLKQEDTAPPFPADKVEPLPRLTDDDEAMAEQIGDMLGDRAAEIIRERKQDAAAKRDQSKQGRDT